MNMTKFESGDDPGFTAVAGELRRWVKEITKLESARSTYSEADGLQRRRVSEDAGRRTTEKQFLRITQSGSQFVASTRVSGGSLFPGKLRQTR